MEDTDIRNIDYSTHYSSATREIILENLLTSMGSDKRISGLLVVGSGAIGFEDVHSDIDLCGVTSLAEDVKPACDEWGVKIQEMFPIFHFLQVQRAPNVYLLVFLLENFLEIDLCFLCADDLRATRDCWKTVLDRSGKIESIQQSSWENRPKPNLEDIYRKRINSIWHYIKYAAIALHRKQPWRAIYEIEQIRNQTVELRGLREELETKRFRHVDQMSADFLDELEHTLVLSLRDDDILNALKATIACFFQEARYFDKILHLNISEGIETKMKTYLEFFDSAP